MLKEKNIIAVDDRLDRINALIVQLASGNLDARETPSDNFDDVDAIIAGINMLGEELQSSTVSRNYLKSIYDGIVDMVIILNEETAIQSVNGAVMNLLNYSEEELVGKSLADIFNTDSERPMGFLDHLDDNKSLRNIQGKLTTKQGAEIPISCSCSVLYDSKGDSAGLLLVAKDMTTQKLFEAELKRSKEAAELSNRLKSSFLANMSHEIRTPLNGILGFTEYLLGMGINAEQKEYLKLIQNSGQTLMKLLSDILDINKIEEGKLTLEYTPIHFKETLTSSLQPYKYMANEKGVDFDMAFENFDNIPYLSCDPTRVNQVLVNLVGNALKFTSRGKVRVKMRVDKVDNNPAKAIISGSVADSGVGIPSGSLDDIFKPFVQSDSSITRKYGGSGLGLSIVKELITVMGGGISVASPSLLEGTTTDCPGTEFNFYFTVDIAEAPVEDTVPDETLSFSSPISVLVVEDNDLNRLLAGKVLAKLGATVDYAEHGQQAVEKVESNVYDAILMDVQMPVMDGLEATRVIRRKGITSPIIGLSANVFKEDVDRSKAAGMNDHLGKPFTKQSIFRAIKKEIA